MFVAIGLASVMAAWVIATQERRFRVQAALCITPPANAEPSTDLHLNAFLRHIEEMPAKNSDWRGRLTIIPVADGESVRLEMAVETPSPGNARRELDAVASSYVERYSSQHETGDVEHPALVAHRRRITDLETRFAKADQRASSLTALATGSVVERRRELAIELERRRQTWQEARRRWKDVHETLEQLLAAPPPTGTVTPDERSQAEAASVPLQQGREALHLRLLEVYQELNQAIKQAAPNLKSLLEALTELEDAVAGQRKEDQSLELEAELERISISVTDFRAATSKFAKAWQELAASLARPADHAVAQSLLDYQAALESLAVDYRFEVSPLADSLSDQIAAIADEGETLTQRLVVQNALRGPHHRVVAAANDLLTAIDKVVTSESFRLDAACRSAGGLTRRVAELHAAISAALQKKADQRAARARTERIAQSRAALTRASVQRDQAGNAVVETLEEILETDSSYRAAIEANARLAATSEHLAALRDQLEHARRNRPHIELERPDPDVLTYTPARIERLTASPNLMVRILMAVSATFIATMIVALIISYRRAEQPADEVVD